MFFFGVCAFHIFFCFAVYLLKCSEYLHDLFHDVTIKQFDKTHSHEKKYYCMNPAEREKNTKKEIVIYEQNNITLCYYLWVYSL